ncbi:hypothetical protein Pan153_28720 [Gimesia panareensis]|uniref:Uncharacterized protein n=1 Tax=Gimesia panareensis TaxID=2527978 RepID=A0A518FPL4_9PLAN|nr:hypothetical protein [Gimesia panareensis]QDV18215.1 hypothetical protein Pan153_28720 [Gimesia panareensis]
MRAASILFVILVWAGCFIERALSAAEEPVESARVLAAADDEPDAAEAKKEQPAEEKKSEEKQATLKPLTPKQLKELLQQRVKGSIGYSFRQFANMFLVSSRLQLGTGVGLMTPDQEIAKIPLLSPFPASYRPTLREFLDSIALQTYSKWKYDPSSRYFKSEIDHKGPFEGLAIFEFTKTKREKPFEVKLAKGWKANDEGTWVMYVPPSFRVGMDIYEMGTYSSDKTPTDPKFFEKIRQDVSLEWAQKMNPKATLKDLQIKPVGKFQALYYEAMIPSIFKKDVKWRQWVFMDGNQCYFIVSTILPELEDKIYPDVEQMLKSFKVKKK